MRQIMRKGSCALVVVMTAALTGVASGADDGFKSSKDLIPELQAPQGSESGSTMGATRGIAPVPSDGDSAGRVDLNIPFEFDSAKLTARGRRQLDELAKALADKSLATFSFQLLGHTDAYGSDAYNQRLSDRRALAVKEYLVRLHGIAPHRVEAVGFGEENPRNASDPYAAENRRVEVINLGRQ